MALFQSFAFLPPSSNPSTPSTQKNQKLKLFSLSQESNNFQTDIILQAMANSFLQRMSGKQDQNNNLLQVLSDFMLQGVQKADLSQRKWCIVQVDEEPLQGIRAEGFKNVVEKLLCNRIQSNGVDHKNQEILQCFGKKIPNTTRPYCLVLNMEGKQLHFQSQQNSNKGFYINFDTVAVTLQKEPVNFRNAKIKRQNLIQNQESINSLLSTPIILKKLEYFQHSSSSLVLFDKLQEKNKNQDTFLTVDKLYILCFSKIQDKVMASLQSSTKCLNFVQKIHSNFTIQHRYASEEQFSKYCQTGDILLFQDQHMMAKVQRTLTNSQYDHVAIVIRTQKHGLCLFESNSGTGVGITSWSRLVRQRWFQNIPKISWRKLQVHNKIQNYEQKVDKFVKDNLYKQFSISLPKLLKFRSSLPEDKVKKSPKQNLQKSYFCSELAATLYKNLGLLELQKSSTQYWPKDFADGNGISIINGSLDPQRQIIFDEEVLKKIYKGFR